MNKLSTLVLIICVSYSAQTQVVYNINENKETSSTPFPSICINCIINIATGVTLTVNSDIYLMNTTFNGGNIVATSKKITFWSQGQFINTKLSFKGNASLVSSSLLVFENSEATFSNNARAVVYSSLQLDSSTFKFLDNSGMEATGGNFELKNGSSLTAGDGSTASKAFIKFNGATLYQHDQSVISLGNFNNYYYNWSSYNTVPNNVSISTLNNYLNCGTGKNPCANPNLYGPSTLSATGAVSSATLPVKLTSFALRPSQTSIVVKWRTEMENNADKFIIQRSNDGVYWQDAGELKAKGNSSVPVDYSFTDSRPSSPLLYYRLKMMDIDKQFEFSPVKSTTLGIHENVAIYPNPAKEYFTVNATAASDTIRGILLSDRGAVLKRFEGQSQVRVDVGTFSPGNYFIKVSLDNGEYANYKLIIVR